MDHYEINVAEADGKTFDGKPAYKHLFATAPRSCTTWHEVKHVYELLKERFPAPQYSVNVTQWESRGYTITHAQLTKKD